MNDRGLSLTPTEMLKGYLLASIVDENKKTAASDTSFDPLYSRCHIVGALCFGRDLATAAGER